MAVQYWVGEFFVDLSRNQITQNDQSLTIAPKALAVLTCLAENQGRVVSYDELFSSVWPNTIVTPNTLQRSIAQLRKVLGENSQNQTLIKTHAKQGYSLECNVKWQTNIDSSPLTISGLDDDASKDSQRTHYVENADVRKNAHFRLAVAIVAMLFIVGLSYQYLSNKKTLHFGIDQVRSITATDDKEFDASYTHDGQYIIFHRYLDNQCGNRLWAKNIKTQKETLLTKEWGAYGRHSLSEDGKKLVFVKSHACKKQPIIEPGFSQKLCYDLVSLNLEQALSTPQSPELILQCQNSEIKDPVWLSTNEIGLFQKSSERWKLISYSNDINRSSNLYDLKEGNLISFTYSSRDKLIAIISVHSDGQHYLDMLKPDGELISSNALDRPAEVARFSHIYPSFDPVSEQLIFSTGKQFFSLSYQGEITKINLPFADRMVQPEFHPNGESLLMIKGPFDTDLALVTLDQNEVEKAEYSSPLSITPHQIIERTNVGERSAIFQPGGDVIAFWSTRSGQEQIWLSGNNGVQQLTQFPLDTRISGMVWAADGKSLLINANYKLVRVFLDSSKVKIPVEHAVLHLQQWNSESNSAVMSVRIKGVLQHLDIDLNTGEFTILANESASWVLKSKDGQLIYSDELGQFWQPGPAEPKLIKAIKAQKSKKNRFIIRDNIIYSINKDKQLWSYNLVSEVFKVIAQLDSEVEVLSDINNTHALVSVYISSKKEVIELALRR